MDHELLLTIGDVKKTHKFIHELAKPKESTSAAKSEGEIPLLHGRLSAPSYILSRWNLQPMAIFQIFWRASTSIPLIPSPSRPRPHTSTRLCRRRYGTSPAQDVCVVRRIKLISPWFLHLGIPTSERLRAGQAPRILTKEDQERMRIVCRVCSRLL